MDEHTWLPNVFMNKLVKTVVLGLSIVLAACTEDSVLSADVPVVGNDQESESTATVPLTTGPEADGEQIEPGLGGSTLPSTSPAPTPDAPAAPTTDTPPTPAVDTPPTPTADTPPPPVTDTSPTPAADTPPTPAADTPPTSAADTPPTQDAWETITQTSADTTEPDETTPPPPASEPDETTPPPVASEPDETTPPPPASEPEDTTPPPVAAEPEDTTPPPVAAEPEETTTSPDSVAPTGNNACLPAPTLPALSVSDPGKTVIEITSESQLQSVLYTMSDNTVLHLAPGTYHLSRSLWIHKNDITIRGDSNRCDEVILVGKGMENASGVDLVPFGIWTASNNLKVQNLTIRDVYRHPIVINGTGQAPHIYNVRLLNAGQQFVKINPRSFGKGSNNGRLEYSLLKYTVGPPENDHGGGTGYIKGIDVHGGSNWVIRNNRFENFHTPDSAEYLYNPAVLMWNGSSNTLVENNVFVNVDRAIAFGLRYRTNDHSGGIIRNNMIATHEGLFSPERNVTTDAAIIVWSSPNTKVLHNTVITQGNTNLAIEFRYNSQGGEVKNNLTDAPISDRDSNHPDAANNVLITDTSIFHDIRNGDLHLSSPDSSVVNSAPVLFDAPVDIDGSQRDHDSVSDAGADEYN